MIPILTSICQPGVRIMLSYLSFPQFPPIYTRPPVLGTMLNCIIMPHNYYNNTWHVLMVKVPCIGYNLWTWSINFKGPPLPADDHRRFRLPTTWDEYTKPKDEFYNKHVTPLVTEPMGCSMTIPLCLCEHLYDFPYVYHFLCLPFLFIIPLMFTW